MKGTVSHFTVRNLPQSWWRGFAPLSVRLSVILSAMMLSLSVGLPALASPGRIIGNTPGSQVNVRSRPSTSAPSPHYGLVGDRVEILDTATGSDGWLWYYIRFPQSGAEGWIRGDFIREEAAAPPNRWSHTYACGDYSITLSEIAPNAYRYQSRSPRGNLNLGNGSRYNSGYSWIYEFFNGNTLYALEDAWDSSRFPGGFVELRVVQEGSTLLRQNCRR